MYQIPCATTLVEPHSLSLQQASLDAFHPRYFCASVTEQQQSSNQGAKVGLQTPPADEMSGTYPSFQYANDFAVPTSSDYTPDNAAAANCHTNLSVRTRPYTQLHLPPLQLGTLIPSHDTNASQSLQQYTSHPDVALAANQPSDAKPYNQQIEWATANTTTAAPGAEDDTIPSSSILPIPRSISESGGSLPEFAAQITCLFWFESIEVLNEAEEGVPPSMVKSLRPEAIPTRAFRKWVVTILATTQVTDKVIILALLFIYRLKKYNSSVRGRNGSEYRLLTVALMLGNKFLDDNTYTNNTWAEVSGIVVQEIHIMEVEFLSNMRYSLLASKEQWEEWHTKLRNFKFYCDMASRVPLVHRSLRPMPSPPESTHASSPPNISHYAQVPLQNTVQWAPPSSTSSSSSINTVPSLPPPPEPQFYPRKRSGEVELDECPITKKKSISNDRRCTNFTQGSHIPPDIPRLSAHQNRSVSQYSSVARETNLQGATNALSTNLMLPPPETLLPPMGSRQMFVTIPSTASWMPQASYVVPSLAQANNFAASSRRTSPIIRPSVPEMLQFDSSPLSAVNFTSHLDYTSPSVFLQQRSSPYKPVRHVQTLLNPPPFGSMRENSVSADEMRYRPLGKRNENLRTGVVPHWPANHQMNHQMNFSA
ncbi:hypothetical protein K3495_g9187 [Podosphaera aphanis]|nr:hypothetical protein K3495_g9187 [Podosphaera aphanis]